MWNEAKQSLGSSLNPNEFFLKLLWSCFGKGCSSSATQAAISYLLCYLGCLLMKRLWGISSSSCSHALELSHTYDLVSSLQARDPDQSSWLMSSFSIHSHVHPLDCNRAAIAGTKHLPQTKPKTWRSHLFTVIISYHQTHFCSCSQAKGLRSCFTKTLCCLEVFPVGCYSQEVGSFYTYLAQWL